MKILFLTKYSSLGASSRYRVYQYLDYFKYKKIKTKVSPLLTENYLKNIYKGKKISRLYLFKRFVKRFFVLLEARKYDLVVIQKELFPYVPPFFEPFLKKINKNIIVDYDDAIFVNYENNQLLCNKIPTIFRLAKAITAGSRYLANYAYKFNNNVKTIPTVVDLKKYQAKKNYSINNKRIVLGWIGTPLTQKYLFEIKNPLKKLSQKYPLLLKCVGSSPNFSINGVKVENVQWNRKKEIEHILTFDVGIMPLTDNVFSRGKCGLKLIQYMGCGIPSVASSIGANKDILVDGENGFLARSNREWIEKISVLIEDKELRKSLGKNGRETIAKSYSIKITAPKLLTFYKKLSKDC